MVFENVVLSVVLCEVNVFTFNILKFIEVLVYLEVQIERT